MSLKFYVTETNETSPPLVKGPFVHLRKDGWNDFNFETQFYFDYYDEKRNSIFSTHVKIMFDDVIKASKTSNLNEKNYIQFINGSFTSLENGFYSIGASESYYVNLQKLDDDTRIKILTSLNDIAFNSDLYNKVKELDLTRDVFRISLMREYSEEEFLNKIRRIAQGGEELTSYSFQFDYNNQNIVDFDVTPECFPPTNTHILIGSNGVGKTYFLNKIIKEYFGKSSQQESISDLLKLIVVSYSPFDRLFQQVEKELLSSRNYSYLGLRDDPDSITKRNFKNGEKIEDEFSNSLWKCATSLSLRRRWENMAQILAIDSYFKSTELNEFIKLIKENQNEEEKENIFPEIKRLFNRLSSGHKIILLSLTRLVELTIEKSLILYDEPETFLHPPLISAYMRALSWLLIDRNAVAIIATHSPIILQEVPRKCVWIIQRDGGFYNIARPDRETFGESVSVLTREIFALELMKSGYYTMISEKVREVIKDTELKRRYVKDITMDEYFNIVMRCFNNEVGSEGQSIILSEIYRQLNESQ